ncbi:MAG TPA: pyridoxine 5'-phosphate synthase [Chthoniobacteraceae bacterium]|jgi:pyridoxine 5-phosphate synthase|nr:pyridoxine 5'-phosphate synthase [Chthoniobacteraceae bacterium]
MRLGVNIDHVATLRQARYAGVQDVQRAEPDLALAAAVCERAGAHGITIHLRADRRHIQDRDVLRLRDTINTKLNLEMGNTPEIVDIALRVLPEEVCLVPENRKEVTTEGGLDVSGQFKQLEPTIKRLQLAGIRVSLFIEPAPDQIEAAAKLRAEMVELHTGAFAEADAKTRELELKRLQVAAEHAHGYGLQVNAGHGINYTNITQVRTIPHLAELNIGHSIVSRGVIVGLGQAVEEMLKQMNRTR